MNYINKNPPSFESLASIVSIQGRGGVLAMEIVMTTMIKKVESNMLYLWKVQGPNVFS